MRFKTGDKVRHKTTGEEGMVLRYEEPTGNLRLEGHNEAQWHHAGDYEAVPDEPTIEVTEGEPVEPEPLPHTPPGPEMGAPAAAATVPESDYEAKP